MFPKNKRTNRVDQTAIIHTSKLTECQQIIKFHRMTFTPFSWIFTIFIVK